MVTCTAQKAADFYSRGLNQSSDEAVSSLTKTKPKVVTLSFLGEVTIWAGGLIGRLHLCANLESMTSYYNCITLD